MNLKRYVDAGQVIDEMAASPPTDLLHGNVLNGMCWEVYEASIKPNGDIPRELIEASIRGSKKSCELDPEANDKLDTLAHLIGVTGDLNRAIELETQAFERETNPTEKSIYRKSLEKMRAKQRQ